MEKTGLWGRNKQFSSGHVGFEVYVKYPKVDTKQAVGKLGLEVWVWKSLYSYLIVITATSSVRVFLSFFRYSCQTYPLDCIPPGAVTEWLRTGKRLWWTISELLEFSAGQAAPSVPTSIARILQLDLSCGVRYSCHIRTHWHQLSYSSVCFGWSILLDLGDAGWGCWFVFASGGVRESHIDFTAKEKVHSLCT